MNVRVDILNDSSALWTPEPEACKSWIASALANANYTKKCGLSLRIVDDEDSKKLNTDFRGIKKPTNVLSFPANIPATVAAQMGMTFLGDLVICAPVLEQEALSQNKPLEAHWAHIVIHGTLHLLGYDHETENQAVIMEKLEIDVLKGLGYTNPYGTH